MSKDIPRYCGGHGTCGRCRVQVIEGSLEVVEAERAFFSEAELANGWRLACQHDHFPDDVVVQVPEEVEHELKKHFAMLGAKDDIDADDIYRVPKGRSDAFTKTFALADDAQDDSATQHSIKGLSSLDIAIDIGTTTVVIAACDPVTGEVLTDRCFLNRQRSIGVDVVSRIDAACNGLLRRMNSMIVGDILTVIEDICDELHIPHDPDRLRMIAVGNTTMLHILRGASCYGLSRYPFMPVFTDRQRTRLKNKDGLNYECELLPGISAFVGADIVAGIYAVGMADREEVTMLVDLGTNGELAIGNKDKIIVASTAAGPALEGGNISCGTGSIPGAIYDVDISQDGRISCRTINSAPALGLCGTGLIAAVGEAYRTGLIDSSGLICSGDEPQQKSIVLCETSGIVLTQRDIREFQLAGAAIRAGIETLMFMYGVQPEEISGLYIAGGFGCGLDMEKAVYAGIIPRGLLSVTEAVGNSAIAGALRYYHERGRLESIVEKATETELAGNPFFKEAYMGYLEFGK